MDHLPGMYASQLLSGYKGGCYYDVVEVGAIAIEEESLVSRPSSSTRTTLYLRHVHPERFITNR